MYKKFVKIILNIFYLFLLIPTISMAMDFSEEDSEESPRLTSKQLRKNIQPVKAKWWQSVEVITPCEEWKRCNNIGNNKFYTLEYLPPEKKWNNPFKREICCFFSTRRNANDLVILEEPPFLFGAERSPVMYLKDAAEIIERENEEEHEKREEMINIIHKRDEENRIKEEKNRKEYNEQKIFLNYKDATYKHGSLGYWTGPFREDEINPLILEDLKKADKNKRERESERLERERERENYRKRRVEDERRTKSIREEEAKAKARKEAETERKHQIYLDSRNDSPETQRKKYKDWYYS